MRGHTLPGETPAPGTPQLREGAAGEGLSSSSGRDGSGNKRSNRRKASSAFVLCVCTDELISSTLFWSLLFSYRIYFRRRQREGREGGAEAGTESPADACAARSQHRDHGLSGSRELDAQPTAPPRPPGFPIFYIRLVDTGKLYPKFREAGERLGRTAHRRTDGHACLRTEDASR